MSLIHEALEKLEVQKKVHFKKPVLEKPIPEKKNQAVHEPPNYGIIYSIAGVLVFSFVVGLVYFLISSHPSQQQGSTSAKPAAKGSLFKPYVSPSQFSLTGMTRVSGDWNAIINNQLVRVGDTINGALVQSIEEAGVTLNFQGQTVQLDMYERHR